MEIKVLSLPLAAIIPCDFNPRKHYDEGKIKELAASIKEKGVIEPIMVRQFNGKYQIIFGERRCRAAKLAGISDIPAIVKQLSDEQVIEYQLIENLQREDVHPLEEAEGYETLLKKHSGTYKTVDDIAAKIGKSKGYIYGRLKLCDLIPENRKLFYEGKFSPSVALLVARVPAHLQKEAGKMIVRGENQDNDPMSYREAQEFIHEDFMLRLKEAQFDLKEKGLANKPSCAECPKRTGNQKELFPDIASADVCTDPGCFEAKKQAFTQRAIAKLKAEGKEVISQDEAKKLFPYEGRETPEQKYNALDEREWNWPKDLTVRKMLKAAKNKDIKIVYAIQPHSGKLIEMVSRADLPKILKNAGIKSSNSSGSTRVRDLAAQKKINRIEGTCQRFWRGKLAGMKDRRCLDVVLLFIALREMSYGEDEEFLKGAIKGEEWDASKLYALGETKVKELLDKAAVRRMQQMDVDDDDLGFLCTKLGFSMAKDYVITKEYLEACTKEELVKLAKELGIPGMPLDQGKKDQLVEYILKHAPKGKVPKELVK